MRVEHRDDGVVVSGFLDTCSHSHSESADTVLVRGAGPYQAQMRSYCFGPVNACDIDGDDRIGVIPLLSPAVHRERDALGLLLAGQGTLEQGGRVAPLAPGTIVFYHGRRPFRLELAGPYRYFVIDLDQADACFRRQARAAVANPELPGLDSGRILTAALVEIAGLAARMGPLTRQEMGEQITRMLRTLIREANQRDPDVTAAGTAVLDRVLNYIDQNLDGELSPESIASAHYISVRYLHALFERQGDTVGNHIRYRRLDRIQRDLADRDLAHVPAYGIAARWGISNPSHFSRLFRTEFGVSPRDFRQERLRRIQR